MNIVKKQVKVLIVFFHCKIFSAFDGLCSIGGESELKNFEFLYNLCRTDFALCSVPYANLTFCTHSHNFGTVGSWNSNSNNNFFEKIRRII